MVAASEPNSTGRPGASNKATTSSESGIVARRVASSCGSLRERLGGIAGEFGERGDSRQAVRLAQVVVRGHPVVVAPYDVERAGAFTTE
ncbi:MAG: hypothetical protein R2705_17445 [Ilumatobacteraceae bacterium]